GLTTSTPQIAAAVAFLEAQQLDHGGWWGRWMVNYCATTSCVLLAFAAVGVDPKSASVRRAVEFLRAHQNSDGGWGEDIDTYAHPERAGMGASMPPLTGMVVTALVAVGEAESPMVEHGVAYLVGQQRSDGTWSNAEWMHCYLPPQYFYYLPG